MQYLFELEYLVEAICLYKLKKRTLQRFCFFDIVTY